VAMGKLEILTQEECLDLLGQAKVGRVGVSVAAIPEIFPVNFCLLNGTIVFRTGEGTKLHAATRGHVVAFEVDDFDADVRHGWSVLVIGHSSEVTHPSEVTTARRLLSDTWVPTERYHVITIVPERVTGRRISERA